MAWLNVAGYILDDILTSFKQPHSGDDKSTLQVKIVSSDLGEGWSLFHDWSIVYMGVLFIANLLQ